MLKRNETDEQKMLDKNIGEKCELIKFADFNDLRSIVDHIRKSDTRYDQDYVNFIKDKEEKNILSKKLEVIFRQMSKNIVMKGICNQGNIKRISTSTNDITAPSNAKELNKDECDSSEENKIVKIGMQKVFESLRNITVKSPSRRLSMFRDKKQQLKKEQQKNHCLSESNVTLNNDNCNSKNSVVLRSIELEPIDPKIVNSSQVTASQAEHYTLFDNGNRQKLRRSEKVLIKEIGEPSYQNLIALVEKFQNFQAETLPNGEFFDAQFNCNTKQLEGYIDFASTEQTKLTAVLKKIENFVQCSKFYLKSMANKAHTRNSSEYYKNQNKKLLNTIDIKGAFSKHLNHKNFALKQEPYGPKTFETTANFVNKRIEANQQSLPNCSFERKLSFPQQHQQKKQQQYNNHNNSSNDQNMNEPLDTNAKKKWMSTTEDNIMHQQAPIGYIGLGKEVSKDGQYLKGWDNHVSIDNILFASKRNSRVVRTASNNRRHFVKKRIGLNAWADDNQHSFIDLSGNSSKLVNYAT